MKFVVSRSSVWSDEKPCDEARQESFVYIDRRTVRTLKEAKLPKYKHWADNFFASGTNHREENGMIARDLDETLEWVIDINSLDDLIEFHKNYGDLILKQIEDCKGIDKEIEIYDSYRE